MKQFKLFFMNPASLMETNSVPSKVWKSYRCMHKMINSQKKLGDTGSCLVLNIIDTVGWDANIHLVAWTLQFWGYEIG